MTLVTVTLVTGATQAQAQTALYDNLPNLASSGDFVANQNNRLANSFSQSISSGLISSSIIVDDLNFTNTIGLNDVARIEGFSFYITNDNTTSLNVNWHVRLFADDAYLDVNNNNVLDSGDLGSYAGSFLKGYDSSSAVTLAAATPGNSTYQRVDVNLSASDFYSLAKGRRTVWVGLFFTADANSVTLGQLDRVGQAVSVDAFDSKGPTGDFSVETQFLNDIATNSNNGPAANYGASPGYTSDIGPRYINDPPSGVTGVGTADDAFGIFNNILTNGTDGANFAWYFHGTILIVPEPGTFALVGVGGLPFLALLRRRKK